MTFLAYDPVQCLRASFKYPYWPSVTFDLGIFHFITRYILPYFPSLSLLSLSLIFSPSLPCQTSLPLLSFQSPLLFLTLAKLPLSSSSPSSLPPLTCQDGSTYLCVWVRVVGAGVSPIQGCTEVKGGLRESCEVGERVTDVYVHDASSSQRGNKGD